ncbi:hypothetical protein [Edaphobacter aggregans]|uniref:hypothetical protein n=1 Tax=Edaphobacter aggregans TaxID=570835 RepID=UPI00146FF344|nr:hypothetical protein [Edaphobacter aggregans]
MGPADQDRWDLEQTFVSVTVPAEQSKLNFTVGRQELQYTSPLTFGAVTIGRRKLPFISGSVVAKPTLSELTGLGDSGSR